MSDEIYIVFKNCDSSFSAMDSTDSKAFDNVDDALKYEDTMWKKDGRKSDADWITQQFFIEEKE